MHFVVETSPASAIGIALGSGGIPGQHVELCYTNKPARAEYLANTWSYAILINCLLCSVCNSLFNNPYILSYNSPPGGYPTAPIRPLNLEIVPSVLKCELR